MHLNLINDLNESRQYRTRYAFKTTSAVAISNHLFLDCIALWILYNEYQYAPVAIDYAKKTTRYNDFSTYRQNSTDMYLATHAITSSDSDLFSDNQADKVLLDRMTMNPTHMRTYLRMVSTNTLRDSVFRQFIQSLERQLRIESSELKSIRRQCQTWGQLTDTEKSLILNKVFKQYRMYARRSELFHLLQSYYNLDVKSATSAVVTSAEGSAIANVFKRSSDSGNNIG